MNKLLACDSLAAITLGLIVLVAIKLFYWHGNDELKNKGNISIPTSSGTEKRPAKDSKGQVDNSMEPSAASSKRSRKILVCPFSSASNFIMDAADHLDPTPLDLFDHEQEGKKEDKILSPPPLGLRWLAAGISGQDQPGHLRAQLQQFRHHRHFLLEDRYLLKELLLKAKGFRERPKETFVMEPDSLDAQQETLEMLMAYLPQTYPDIYKYNRERHSITVIPMEKEFFLKDYQDKPLQLCGRIVQEDLVLMRESPATSSYNMAAAAVVFSFNDLPRRLGTSTNFIHAPVPGFEKHLSKVLYLSFKSLRAEKPLWRNNWSIVPSGQIDEPSDSVTHEEEMHALANQAVQDRFLKVEYQTIRRLPRTKYLLFTIRTFTDPVVSLEQIPPKAASTLAASVRGMAPSMLEYRGIESQKTKEALLQYLDSISGSAANNKDSGR